MTLNIFLVYWYAFSTVRSLPSARHWTPEYLYPVMPIFAVFLIHIAYAKLRISFIQYISAMSGTIHPLLHHLGSGRTPGCNIFSHSRTGMRNNRTEITAIGPRMGKFTRSLLCPDGRCILQFCRQLQRSGSRPAPFLIDKLQYLPGNISCAFI